MTVFKNRKALFVFVAVMIAIMTATMVYRTKFTHSNGLAECFTIPQCGNGDAKFFGKGIITSIGGQLTLLDLSGETVKRFDVNSNWIDGIDEEGIIIYGNFYCETGLLKLDENYNITEQNVILQGGALNIDPTITKINGQYYITVTEINGNVNNSTADVENGLYTVHMLVSDDCAHWEPLSDIAKEHANLEDVDIRFSNGVLYACYEQEVLDKGDSSIMVRHSEDYGRTWSPAITLLEPDCDHEPVSFIPNEDGFTLYYSCDLEDRGGTYMSGRIYSAHYNRDFECIEKDQRIKTNTKEGILWYDYAEIDGKAFYLFAGNYLTDNDMIVEVTSLDSESQKE